MGPSLGDSGAFGGIMNHPRIRSRERVWTVSETFLGGICRRR